MNSNSDNPKVGKDFQRKVLSIAQKTFNMPFDEEKVVPVGNPPKEHRFDVVSADGDIIIECKCYTWTNGGNVPSAKMSTLNEAVLYLRSVNYNARKILAMKKDVRLRTGESLAEYYCRIYGHLLEDIEVWEVAEEGIVNIVRKKQINGGNVPSAKMSTLNEAVLYLRSVNYNARKILAMKKDVRLRTGESLAEYYCRIYGHLLEDIEVWEVAEEGIVNIVRKKQINDSEMS